MSQLSAKTGKDASTANGNPLIATVVLLLDASNANTVPPAAAQILLIKNGFFSGRATP